MTEPGWFRFARRVVIFLLGVAVILDALIAHDSVIAELIVGMVLVGILPLDDLLTAIRRRPGRGPARVPSNPPENS